MGTETAILSLVVAQTSRNSNDRWSFGPTTNPSVERSADTLQTKFVKMIPIMHERSSTSQFSLILLLSLSLSLPLSLFLRVVEMGGGVSTG